MQHMKPKFPPKIFLLFQSIFKHLHWFKNNWYQFFDKDISISLYALLFMRNGIAMKSNIVEKFNQLPPDLQEKAIKYIDSLLTQKELRRKKKKKFDWAGGLKEFRDDYTSVELQEKALDWIVEMVLVDQIRIGKNPPR